MGYSSAESFLCEANLQFGVQSHLSELGCICKALTEKVLLLNQGNCMTMAPRRWQPIGLVKQ
jgi:hypothetical protein